MKYLIVSTLIFNALMLNAQNKLMSPDKPWEMDEHYAIHKNERIDFYKKGEINNLSNFDDLEYIFKTDGILATSHKEGFNDTKNWLIYSNNDSLKIGKSRYQILSFTKDEIKLKSLDNFYGLDVHHFILLKPVRILETNNFKLNDHISISFHQTNNYLNINFVEFPLVQHNLKIFTLQGKNIFSQTLGKEKTQSISLQNLLPGMYIVKVINKNAEAVTKKIIKLH